MDSRRERKKQQTRRLISEVALELFISQGYEQTTVAQIAAAADVATKTFFNYFPSKEDVLLSDKGHYGSEIPVKVIAERHKDESIPDLLARAYEASIGTYLADGPGLDDPDKVGAYRELVMSVPALQAKALQRAHQVQREVATALLAAYPDKLDPVSAAAIVGAVAGAAQAASLEVLARGEGDEKMWEAMRRAINIALYGLENG
ncbi:TetR/AcrR family transcriptional regulator [Kibdelosporangium philippinense]|uniref:TetR/AcrR family transcriptional regulator n=1 Tax=Kibdelosporangium philippinense TaxID=211113 RepID=A0ABS8Z541_9PSEU|nr:TetR family transcriptional regulator [Kibdelosporangium philippinense]MCE7002945.1 TetR/AcrR family transcriptional regulator [Kibdelosporangium philippinense]